MTTTRPVQEFYSIGEVCALTDLKPHVLRYWESQFRFLNPAKNRSGNRVYKSREVELIMLVKHLLYTEKFTIDGARQRIDQYRRTGELRASARKAFEAELAAEVRAAIERGGRRCSTAARTGRADEHSRHQRRRHPRPGTRAARRRLPRGRDGHRGGPRPGAERHLALAHAAPAAPARAPARRRLADRRDARPTA